MPGHGGTVVRRVAAVTSAPKRRKRADCETARPWEIPPLALYEGERLAEMPAETRPWIIPPVSEYADDPEAQQDDVRDRAAG